MVPECLCPRRLRIVAPREGGIGILERTGRRRTSKANDDESGDRCLEAVVHPYRPGAEPDQGFLKGTINAKPEWHIACINCGAQSD
jgi:hypothetical protein